MRKRLITFLLVACMIVCMCLVTTASAASTTGTDYTSGQLAERLDTIMNQGISSGVSPAFPAVGGTYARHKMYTVKFPSRSWRGYQCMAYAYSAYNYLFDSDPYSADAVSFDNDLKARNTLSYQDFVNHGVRIGAYLRTTCHSNGEYHTYKGHSIIILSYDQAQVTYIEGNTISDQTWRVNLKSCNWAEFNKNLLSGKGRYVQTLRQPSNAVYDSLTGGGDSGNTTPSESGYWEYRYGGYITSDGNHTCWCQTYLQNKFGSANLRYSEWSTTQYSANGLAWTCGNCKGNHTGVDHYDSKGRPWWPEYNLPSGCYFWEESRWVEDEPSVDQPSTEPADKWRWGEWSEWSDSAVSASDTRQVETRQVEDSSARTEYRYGRYVYFDYRRHECWCETYMTKLFGNAALQYSDWGTTRYSPTGKGWTCGTCNGNHIGIDHYSNGKPYWAEYSLPDGDYFWEETRTVAATQKTQYRYRDWICD